ncbi:MULTISPECIES: hypothetical protein [unclassified Mesorhizobium]|uniref:hypothetical protein n=1 Tax=unclassified Mesorhizobium TaxID=325217 RepID=UPI0003CDF993|nr:MULTISPECIES: hypothetical protein [unclassified Mesorhizobium]ESY52789.1 hypothetical protein X744_28850 [Mesorhizobium sp. LNJC372A00]WJI81510.1 hypothetical protein NLY34_01735 [Mesorhizobium sp. C374B]WJI88029.1 hypothetical protein NLY42_04150 [Mesorhizobium sp. C372A]
MKALFSGLLAALPADYHLFPALAGRCHPILRVTIEKQFFTRTTSYAAGDAARMMHNIAFVVSGGGMAGIAARQSLVFG